MRQETMDHYGIIREFSKAGFYETERHRQILRELKSAVQQGKFVTMSGIVGCGKTTTLHRLQEQLETEGDILVAKSLSVDKECVSLAALLMALFYDLSTEKDLKIPSRPEKRERALRELIKRDFLRCGGQARTVSPVDVTTVIGSQLMYYVDVAAELLADVEEQTVRSVHQAQRPGRESPGQTACQGRFQGVPDLSLAQRLFEEVLPLRRGRSHDCF